MYPLICFWIFQEPTTARKEMIAVRMIIGIEIPSAPRKYSTLIEGIQE